MHLLMLAVHTGATSDRKKMPNTKQDQVCCLTLHVCRAFVLLHSQAGKPVGHLSVGNAVVKQFR